MTGSATARAAGAVAGSSPAPSAPIPRAETLLNRELSLLDFNRRVLEQARDPGTPLLERLTFLTICSRNLDEFFEIRVAGLRQQAAWGLDRDGVASTGPAETLVRVSELAHRLVEDQNRVLNREILPALAAEGIRVLGASEWNPRQARWVRRHFLEQVLPVLTPVGLDPAHPFPPVLNKGLAMLVRLEGQDAFRRAAGVAAVPVPRSLPRLIRIPSERGRFDFALLSSTLSAHIGELFPGMELQGSWPFRVTRDSDLWVDDEEVDDLLRALKGELVRRNFGTAVRIEVARDMPDDLVDYLLEQFGLTEGDLYRVDGPVNVNRLARIVDLVDRPDLKYPPFVPGTPRRLGNGRDVFEVLRHGDVLLHHPYESFAPVLELLRRAARDPQVLAIRQTLYRTGSESAVADALIEAARAGKEVTVVVELRARFDEAANIDLATRLQEAGANVAYGVVGHKAHAKMLMIVRREGRRIRRYCHLGTGNYHTATSRAYTDLGLLTADKVIGDDIDRLFLQLTGLGRPARLRKLLYAPFTLRKTVLALVEREAEAAAAGRPARIAAKMNALTDPEVAVALCRASQAGVPIDLVVRGICCLRPGVPGWSDTIRVRSIVGRFLEHSRAWHFHAGGEDLLYLSSADWMERNFDGRVEVAFPIEDARLKARVLDECLDVPLADSRQAWRLGADGTWRRARARDGVRRSSQEELLEALGGAITHPPSEPR